MADNNLQQIKERLNIVDIIGEKVLLKKRGRNFFGLCPFHGEKSPSFSVNEELQIYKCFGCGKHGDIFTFIEETDHLDFKEALETLAKKAGIELENINYDPKYSKEKKLILELNELACKVYEYCLTDLQSGEPGRKYAKERLLNRDLAKQFRIGYAPSQKDFLVKYLIDKKGYNPEQLVLAGLAIDRNGEIQDKFKYRLMFPVINNVGEVVAFSGRYIGPKRPAGQTFMEPPKYLNSPETAVFHKSHVLYGLFHAKEEISKKDYVIISEGQMNIISSHKVGIPNIVASLGTSLTIDHLKTLSRYTQNILFCFDGDKAGQTALVRSIGMANQLDLTSKVVSLNHGKDPDEEIKYDIDGKEWLDDIENAQSTFQYILDKTIGSFSLKSDENKWRVAKEVIDVYISNVKNAIKEDLYISTLSKNVGVDKTSIIEYLKDRKEKPISAPVQEPTPEKTLKDIQKNTKAKANIEDYFIAFLIQNWDELKKYLANIDASYFLNEKYVNILLTASFATEESIEGLLNSLEEEEKNILEDAMLKYISPLDEKVVLGQEFQSSYKRVKENFIKTKIRELKKTGTNIDSDSNEETEESMQTLQDLTNQLIELRNSTESFD